MATLPFAHVGELESAATIVALTVLGFLYAVGCLELSRVGRSWPAARTFSFFIGLSIPGSALVIPRLMTGTGTSDFEIHAIQHLLLGMLAPVFFALSAPTTLVLAWVGGA